MSSSIKDYLCTEYLQSNSNDETKQSPLELLAQTCSSIGKDCPMTSTHITKSASSSNILNSDKSLSSTRKNSSPAYSNPTSKKSTHSLKSKTSNYRSPQIDPSFSTIRSPLAYLLPPPHSYSTICTIRGCLHCETLRYFLSNSLHSPMYSCECKICNARFYSNEQLIEHVQYNHPPTKISNRTRFHPYSKASNRINLNDQLPLFYPDLSMSSSMNHIIRCLNTNPHFYK